MEHNKMDGTDESNGHIESKPETRNRALELNEKRRELERELQQYQDILQSNGVGMDDALVTEDGFPRNDIDVHLVRTARNRIICLNNDLRDIMKQIEDALFGYFEAPEEV